MSHSGKQSANGSIDAAAADWIVRRDAGLNAGELAEFEQWRSADARHAAALAWHEQTWTALDHPRRAGKGGVMLEKLAASAARRRRRQRRVALGGLVLVLFAGFAWHVRQSPPLPLPLAPAATARVVLPDQQMLPDGSLVELRSGAQIAVDFGATLRRVSLLAGEAHFTVAKNHGRPFVVVARGVEVRAIGTAFAVELGAMQVDVVVTEGEVSVAAPMFTQPEAVPVELTPIDRQRSAVPLPRVLTAWQRVSVPLESTAALPVPTVLPVADAELAQRLAWRGTRLEFTDTPLLEALALMNQHASGPSKVRLVVDDPLLARTPVTGLFRADNSETFVRLLEASFNLKAERSGDTFTLRKAR